MKISFAVFAHPGARCVAELALSLLIASVLFRPFNRQTVVGRVPVFLETGGLLLLGFLSDLPFLFPSVFELVMRHPLYDSGRNGTWMIQHWWAWLIVPGIAAVLVGGIWAVINLALRRAVALNVVALFASALWVSLFLLAKTGMFVWYL